MPQTKKNKTISVSSRKAKARNLQNEIKDKFLALDPTLNPLEIATAVMGESGEDIKFSPTALKKFPFAVEAKSYARHAVYKFYEQAQTHSAKIEKKSGIKTQPLVVLKQNHSKPLVLLDLDGFLAILKKSVDKCD